MDRLSFQYPRLAVGRRHGRHNGQRHLRTSPTCPLMRACPNSTAAVIPMPARKLGLVYYGDIRACGVAIRTAPIRGAGVATSIRDRVLAHHRDGGDVPTGPGAPL